MRERSDCLRSQNRAVLDMLMCLCLCSVGVTLVDSKIPSSPTDSTLGLYDYDESMDTAEIVFVTAVSGGNVKLPCAVESPSPAYSTVRLMLWYKDGSGVPFFSYDMRNRAQEGRRQSGHDSLGNRASMTSLNRESRLTPPIGGSQLTSPALLINNVQLKDGGMFRCRVDFKSTPTLNARVNLTVIVAPNRISFVTKSGHQVESSWGPLDPYQNASIVCRSQGHPAPNVTWWRNGKLISVIWTSENGWSSNILTLVNISRADLNAEFQCRAMNTYQRLPVVRSLQLDINLSPMSVQINRSEAGSTLSAGQTTVMTCLVKGSRPSPTILWSRNGHPITENITEEITDEYSISKYHFVPTIEDGGTSLQCSAYSPALPHLALNDSVKLAVNFKPMLRLRAGRTLNLANIKQNDDVYFECKITARPAVFSIDWLLNNKSLSSSSWPGVVISGHSLAVQHVQRNSSGLYSCRAANSEGVAFSNAVNLDVKHAPICATTVSKAVAVARFQPAVIECKVLANPARGLTFSWTFNNTGDLQTLPEDNFRVDTTSRGGVSNLNYEVRSELDYGTLQCSATNSIGAQQRPCLVHVLPAGAPDRPSNCQLLNHSSTSVHVKCNAALSYGSADDTKETEIGQRSVLQFFLEVVGPDGAVQFNQTTSGVPAFTVTGLQPSTHYQLVVYAFNVKGRSEAMVFSAETLQEKAERRTEQIIDGHFKDSWNAWMTTLPLATIVVTISFGVVASICVTTLVLRQRRWKRHPPAVSESGGMSVDTSTSVYPAATSAPGSYPPPSEPNTTLTRLLSHTQTAGHTNSDIIFLQNRPMNFDCPLHTSGARYYDSLSKPAATTVPPASAEASSLLLGSSSLPRRSPYSRQKQFAPAPSNDASCLQLRSSKPNDSTSTLPRASCLKTAEFCPVSPLDVAASLLPDSCPLCVSSDLANLPAPHTHVQNSSISTSFGLGTDGMSCPLHSEQAQDIVLARPHNQKRVSGTDH